MDSSAYPPTDMQMGVVPIFLESLVHQGDSWFLFGQNFTPYCKVGRNGELLETEYISERLLRVLEDPETEDVEELSIRVVDRHRQVLSDTE